MNLRNQGVEYSNMATMLQKLVRNVRTDKARAPVTRTFLCGIRPSQSKFRSQRVRRSSGEGGWPFRLSSKELSTTYPEPITPARANLSFRGFGVFALSYLDKTTGILVVRGLTGGPRSFRNLL